MPIGTLRDLMRQVQAQAPDNIKSFFRPFSTKGGPGGNNDHRTRAGLVATLEQAAKDRERDWQLPDPKSFFRRTINSFGRESAKFIQPALVEKHRLTRNGNEIWMDADSIDTAVAQQTALLRTFAFLGVWNGNAQSLRCLKARLTAARANARIHKFGVILNTDDRGGGAHWVAVVCNTRARQRTIYYFDSFGRPASAYPGHQAVVNALAHDLGISTKEHNKKDVQGRNHYLCGPFAVYCVVQMAREGRVAPHLYTIRNIKKFREDIVYVPTLARRRRIYNQAQKKAREHVPAPAHVSSSSSGREVIVLDSSSDEE